MALRSSTFNFDDTRLLRALTWTLGLWLALEVGLSFVPENVMIRTHRWVKAMLAREPAPAVQVHGDSVVRNGVFATDVERALPPGTRVVNAGLQGSGPEFVPYLLEHQLAAGRVPGAIVIAHSPHTLLSARLGLLVGEFADAGQLPEAFASGGNVFDAIYGVLCRGSFLLRHRVELGDALRGKPGELRTWNDPIPTEAHMRAILGEDEARRAGRPPEPLPPMHEVYRQRFAVDPAVRHELARALALAKARGIRVYWYALPEHAALAAARDSVGFGAAYGRFVDSLATRGDVVVLRRDPEVWPASDFTDYTHLRLPAAIRVSRDLGERLAAAGAGTPAH